MGFTGSDCCYSMYQGNPSIFQKVRLLALELLNIQVGAGILKVLKGPSRASLPEFSFGLYFHIVREDHFKWQTRSFIQSTLFGVSDVFSGTQAL